jgi:hypothetical protein
MPRESGQIYALWFSLLTKQDCFIQSAKITSKSSQIKTLFYWFRSLGYICDIKGSFVFALIKIIFDVIDLYAKNMSLCIFFLFSR